MLQNVSVLQNLRRFRAVAVVLGNDQDNFAAFFMPFAFAVALAIRGSGLLPIGRCFFAAVVLLATVKF